MSDIHEQTRIDTLTEVAGVLRRLARERFLAHGGLDPRGAAFWDAAAHIEDEMLAAYPAWERKRQAETANIANTYICITEAGRRLVESMREQR